MFLLDFTVLLLPYDIGPLVLGHLLGVLLRLRLGVEPLQGPLGLGLLDLPSAVGVR